MHRLPSARRPGSVGPVGLAVVTLLLLGALPVQAAEPPLILREAGAAVTAKRIEKGKILGFDDAKKRFTELPPMGAVLVGFDCGVGKFFDYDMVYALRPIYLTADGEMSFEDHGLFSNKFLPGKKVIKSKVLRTESIKARPGYAVGALTLRSGLFINGLSVTFMRINGRTLDPSQAYESAWVGDRTGGSEHTVSGDGAPVVGVQGSQDQEIVTSLGLIVVDQPAVAAPPPPIAPAPPAAPRTEVPVVPPAEPAGDEPRVNRPRPGHGAEQPAEGQRGEVDPIFRAPARTPARADDHDHLADAAPAKNPAPVSAARNLIWVPFMVFGVVLVPVLVVVVGLVAWKVHASRRPGKPGAPQKRAPKRPLAKPSTATGIRERPAYGAGPQSDLAGEDDIPVLELADEGPAE